MTRNYRDIKFIDEKEFLEYIIKKQLPIVEEVFGSVFQFGEEIYLNFRDPTIVLSPRLKTFKRRFIAIPKVDIDNIDFKTLPVVFDELKETKIASKMDLEDEDIVYKDRLHSGLLTLKYKKNNISLALTINAEYETVYDQGLVEISAVETYYHPLYNQNFYLITLELNFKKVRLANKIFKHETLPQNQALDSMFSALHHNDEDFIPLICESMDAYRLLDRPIESIDNHSLLTYSVLSKRNIYTFWYLLRMGANLDVVIDSEVNGVKNKFSLIQYMVQEDMHKHLILSYFIKPNYEVVDTIGQYPALVAVSKFEHQEISSTTFIALFRILCGPNEVAIQEKIDKVNIDVRSDLLK